MDGSQAGTEYPVVLRFAGLYPHHLAGYEAHRTRKGGDLNHVDRTQSHLNRRLIGDEDWAAQALAEIREMTDENYADELAALERRKRRKDIKRRMVEGPKQPWRPTRHGPMRELILTANREWFDEDLSGFFGEDENPREEAFETRAIAWLRANFGDDVIHARADRDEAAYHIHAVILPRATVDINGTKRRMLQPSKHPLIKDYEAAQDSIGAWFAEIGLTRGERRAAAIRKARTEGKTPPKRRTHARTAKWRAAEELRLKGQRETQDAREADLERRTERVAARESEADTVLAVADGIAAGTLDIDTAAETPRVKRAGANNGPDPTPPDGLDLDALAKASPDGVARAAAALGAAFRRLVGRASAEARDKVAQATAEIAAADDAIVEAAKSLRDTDRARIAGVRRSLVPRLDALRRWLRGDDRRRLPQSPSSDSEER